MGANSCKALSPKSSKKVKPTSGQESSYCKMKDNEGNQDEFIEDVVCKTTDIQDNEMKLLPLGSDGGKILLIKQHGHHYAMGTKCTHYGALLNTGALGEGRVRCPWHGACFNIKTGDIEDYPGLNSLPTYQVTVDNDLIKVKAKKSHLSANYRLKDMCRFKSESLTAVLIGGGPASATCAETLRQEGFDGRIIIICKENTLPYDRVKVSKTLDLKIENILLRSKEFYNEHNIELKLGMTAESLDTQKQIITLCNCEQISYNYLFIATGSKPRKPNIPGVELKNIFTIRDYVDAENVQKLISTDKDVVVLGTGFIGMEIAAYCLGKVKSVTIIGRDDVPMKAVFGDEIGYRIKKEFIDKGAIFITNSGISEFIQDKNNKEFASQVKLTDEKILPADIIIVGIGSNFYTDWLKGSNIKMLDNGSIEVDKYLKTNINNIFAGGDIAHAPVYCAGDVNASIGHYSLAHYHGRIAAFNICGKETPLKSVPFFWTTLFGKGFRYAGFGKPSSIKIHGSLDDLKFFAYYYKDGKVIAMSSVGRDPIVSDFANIMYEGITLTEEEVEKDPLKWMRNRPKDLQIQNNSTNIL